MLQTKFRIGLTYSCRNLVMCVGVDCKDLRPRGQSIAQDWGKCINIGQTTSDAGVHMSATTAGNGSNSLLG